MSVEYLHQKPFETVVCVLVQSHREKFGTGRQENAMEGSFKGEVTYKTNSPRLSWLNNTKGWVEGMTDQKNNEATIKVYAEASKSEKTPEVAAPMM